MNNAVFRYRVKFVLTSLGVGAGVALVSRALPAGLQPFSWGVAAGLVAMIIIIVIGWLMKGIEPADPIDVRRNITTRSRQMKLMGVLIFPGGIGVALLLRFGFPSDAQDVVAGVAVGVLLMAAILVGPSFWTSAKSNSKNRRIAPLEEPSPHTLIVPSAMHQHADRHGSGEVP